MSKLFSALQLGQMTAPDPRVKRGMMLMINPSFIISCCSGVRGISLNPYSVISSYIDITILLMDDE
jgi:hypothetical protein